MYWVDVKLSYQILWIGYAGISQICLVCKLIMFSIVHSNGCKRGRFYRDVADFLSSVYVDEMHSVYVAAVFLRWRGSCPCKKAVL